jgi:hypothetical protein
MTVVEEYNVINQTRAGFVNTAAELLGDTARYAQNSARFNARFRSGELRDKIELHPENAGLEQVVVADALHSIYNEFGTGIYATGEGGSQAEQIPWVYYDEYLGQFFTTEGLRPQPFMRPGYDAAVDWFWGNAGRYFS